MKPLFFALILLFLTVPVPAPAKDARPLCACLARGVDRRFAEAGAVFIGTVKEIAPFDEVTKGGGSGRWNKNLPQADPPVAVTLRVDHVYKGAEKETPFILHTSLTRYTCSGHPFERGRQYLVFAYLRDIQKNDDTSLYSFPPGTYEVGGLCGGTREISQAAPDVIWLERKTGPK